MKLVIAEWRENIRESKVVTLSVFINLILAIETMEIKILVKVIMLYGRKDKTLNIIIDVDTKQMRIKNIWQGQKLGCSQGINLNKNFQITFSWKKDILML